MALQLASMRARLRTSFVRSLFWTGREAQQNCVHQQQRGKKKLAWLAASLKVKLLEDVPKYGRRGEHCPRMRAYEILTDRIDGHRRNSARRGRSDA